MNSPLYELTFEVHHQIILLVQLQEYHSCSQNLKLFLLQAEDWSNTIKSPEYQLVGCGQKLLLKAQNSTDTRDSLCATPEPTRSVLMMSNTSIPDITRRKTPDFTSERGRRSKTPDITDICAGDPYGPMSGRNLRGIVQQDNLEDEYSEHDSYFIAPASCSRNSTPRQRLKNSGDSLDPCNQVNPTYHAYCDIHCQCKHSQNSLRRSGHNINITQSKDFNNPQWKLNQNCFTD